MPRWRQCSLWKNSQTIAVTMFRKLERGGNKNRKRSPGPRPRDAMWCLVTPSCKPATGSIYFALLLLLRRAETLSVLVYDHCCQALPAGTNCEWWRRLCAVHSWRASVIMINGKHRRRPYICRKGSNTDVNETFCQNKYFHFQDHDFLFCGRFDHYRSTSSHHISSVLLHYLV